jgi:hypothetical protein
MFSLLQVLWELPHRNQGMWDLVLGTQAVFMLASFATV